MPSPSPFDRGDPRLAALRRYGVFENPDTQVLDDLVQLAAHACHAPIAAVAFVDERRVVFTSRIGLPRAETPRDGALCAETIHGSDVFVVSDASADARFARHSLVADEPHVRAYAGAPLILRTGEAIGALCVMDPSPRQLSDSQLNALRALARQVVHHLEQRRTLSERERLLSTIIDSEPECVKLLGQDGSLLMMNRAGLQMIEAESADQVLGQSVYALVAKAHRAAFRELTTRVFRGEPGSLEFEMNGLRGGSCWLETHAVPLRDETGGVTAMLAITRDITARKRAEAALLEREKHYRALFEEAADAIFVTTGDGRILDVNAAACDMTGYRRHELVAHSITEFLIPDERPRVEPEIRRLATGRRITTEWRGRQKHGATFVAEVTAKQLPDGRILGFARDVTDRKLAEVALREADHRLRRALHAGRVGLWDWEPETNAVHYSAEWKRQIGFEEGRHADDFDRWKRRIHPEDLPAVEERMTSLLHEAATDAEFEFRFRHKNGSYRRIMAHASKIVDEDGRTRVLGSQVDITERAELQAQLQQAQKMESIGRLAGGIAHDFNNLLTVINGLADLALSSVEDTAPLHPDLKEIRLAGEKAAALTRQLLAMSRQQILKPRVLNLSVVVGEMQTVLTRLIGEDVACVFRLADDLGSIRADPSQIEQVILNIAVNARDAMPTGGTLTIKTRNVEPGEPIPAGRLSTPPGPHVLLTIRDTGIGMDEATRRRIFEPFFTTKDLGKGTGLGLSTVYGIVKQSGGTIWVSSEPGQGTSFHIYFPRVRDLPAERPHLRDRPGREMIGGTETILLVEDEAPLRQLAQRILEGAGYTVIVAANGEEALERLRHTDTPVHLMLTDVVMPGMSGRELATRLGRIRPRMRVLYTSGYTNDAIARHGVLDDERCFLSKPYTATELRRRVRDLLDDPSLATVPE